MSLILVSEIENAIHITLNRPEALNAINHDMVLDITRVLKETEMRDDVKEVIFKGGGDRAFCAGGDIKSVYYQGLKNPRDAFQYFYDEYEMNKIIHGYSKPIISICHGFVMGGGYGVAGNGSHIIVDGTTKFAMPETAIGFFPDVGIGWKLARAGALGMYIALTGDVFDADMMMAAGLATHKVDDAQQLSCPLYAGIWIPAQGVEDVFIKNRDKIEEIFSKESLEDIWHALEKDNSDFAQKTLSTLKTRSPISLHVTFKHLIMARGETYNQSIARDYRLACAFFTKPDIYEGIRAAVIDKDKNPKWSSSSILNISPVDIDYYLQFSDDNNH